MNDIGGFGLVIQVMASFTFPAGVTITQLADDTDPFDIPSIDIGDAVTGVNGDLIVWPKTAPIPLSLAVIAEGDDDENLSILLEANRVAKGKNSIRDVITITGIYPSGKIITVNNGKIISGMPGNSVSSAGRLKTKVYGFKFENKGTS